MWGGAKRKWVGLGLRGRRIGGNFLRKGQADRGAAGSREVCCGRNCHCHACKEREPNCLRGAQCRQFVFLASSGVTLTGKGRHGSINLRIIAFRY
jgi:hypothetical protein